MYAVIETGGKQYRVEDGIFLDHERIDGMDVGETITFDKVLLVVDEGGVRVGTPYLDGVTSKKGYRRKQGHRQSYMRTKITAIEA
jgi:large subunit ribosomal protein L21